MPPPPRPTTHADRPPPPQRTGRSRPGPNARTDSGLGTARAHRPAGPVRRLYGWFRLLSLDVAVGALAGGSMITGFLRMEMPTAWYLILPAAVWSIYTWDHLLDAQRLGPDASTPRHRFHHRHFRILGLSTILGALLSTAAAVLFLGPKGLVFGLCMGGFAALHFLLVQFVGGRTSPLLVKELGVALVYCLGIWGLPAIESGRIADPVLWIGFGQFFLLALTNLFEFSLFELRIDEADGHTSYVRALGETRTVQLIGSVLTASLLLGAIGILRYGLPAFLRLEATYLPMALILGAILWRRELFAGEERYRAWGDGAFLLPFLYRLIP